MCRRMFLFFLEGGVVLLDGWISRWDDEVRDGAERDGNVVVCFHRVMCGGGKKKKE